MGSDFVWKRTREQYGHARLLGFERQVSEPRSIVLANCNRSIKEVVVLLTTGLRREKARMAGRKVEPLRFRRKPRCTYRIGGTPSEGINCGSQNRPQPHWVGLTG